jgi:methylamine dehydrogenase accessory protein MauD
VTTQLLIASSMCLWLLALCLAGVVYFLARQLSLLFMRVGPVGARMFSAGPAIGDLAPELLLTDTRRRSFRLGGTRNHRLLMMFVSPRCPACDAIATSFSTLAKSEPELDLVLIGYDSEERIEGFLRRHNLANVTYLVDDQAAIKYGITVVPYAVLVDPSGTVVAKGLVNNVAHLESILNVEITEHAASA